MKAKLLKFADNRTAIVSGMHIEVNKQKPILEEEIETDKDTFRQMLLHPKKIKLSKRAKKII